MSEDAIKAYLNNLSNEDVQAIADAVITKQATEEYKKYSSYVSDEAKAQKLAAAFDLHLSALDEATFIYYYDNHMPATVSDISYNDLLKELGVCDFDSPSYINIYPIDFEMKDNIADMIERYNETASKDDEIKYTDYVGIMMSSVTTIINAITYVLIAFVAISLVVSSIMIGVITLISVQERTKEIGILRAIGASKKNVSRMFNAETMIIGFTSGALGVGVTYILCIITNIILHSLTGIQNLNAYLPFSAALILIAISVLLTLISGIIPSRSASKKDPVVALRTE
jgi:putative ABC transport system permease protein